MACAAAKTRQGENSNQYDRTMKKQMHRLMAVGLFTALAGITAIPAMAQMQESIPIGSIHPAGKVKRADLPTLAKISLDDAMKAAQAKVPGTVIGADLKMKQGSLLYAIKIVGANKAITGVEIDAGDGKVLVVGMG
jgi:uncharacterized membrane protein YkoI